jgi:hypothetical protein
MIFADQVEAKRFFMDRVSLQAEKERIPLSGAEKYMLGWTETEEGFEIHQEYIDAFREETSEPAFEEKVRSLLGSAYEADVSADRDMRETYRNAYKTLREGDHYILVMIDESIGRKLRRWGLFL